MASAFVVDREIAIIRERQARGDRVHFYPLLLRPTPKVALDKVRDLNLRPHDAKPFSEHSFSDRERHMAVAADEIAEIAESIARKKNVLDPPEILLPAPRPAAQFTYADGQFDVVPSQAWQNREWQASRYHGRASDLAAALADRLAKTDAVPDVAASVRALINILGESVDRLQPDLLRLASRSIAAKARAFGHPSAAWEISVESVSAIFELADVLVDLQSFVRSDLEEHEAAIRQLELTPETAAGAKEALDIVTDGILSNRELMSERAEAALEAAASVSATATDERVQVAVEGDRILVTSNLALAVARELGRADASAIPNHSTAETQSAEIRTPKSKLQGKPGRSTRQRRTRTTHRSERSWEDFIDRVLVRIEKKGPDAIGDAVIQAAVSTIKHTPKTIAALGAIFVLWSALDPIILGGGTMASILAWIGFRLRQHQPPTK